MTPEINVTELRQVPDDADDAFWDCEAIKLKMFFPWIARLYSVGKTDLMTGNDGLWRLGFCDKTATRQLAHHPAVLYNAEVVRQHGPALIAAIGRLRETA